MRSHWLGPHPCIGQSAARRPSSPLRFNFLAHARAVSRKPHRHPSRCQILSAGSFARLGSLTRNSLRFSWSLSEMRPLRLLRASECVARRAAPGSCSAPRAQPRRGLDRAEQSIREHGTHNFLWAEECNFMPQPSKSGQGGLSQRVPRRMVLPRCTRRRVGRSDCSDSELFDFPRAARCVCTNMG